MSSSCGAGQSSSGNGVSRTSFIQQPKPMRYLNAFADDAAEAGFSAGAAASARPAAPPLVVTPATAAREAAFRNSRRSMSLIDGPARNVDAPALRALVGTGAKVVATSHAELVTASVA